MTDSTLSERMSVLARDLQSEEGVTDTTDHVVDAVAQLVSGCDHAAITLAVRHRRVETGAATSDTARAVDGLQAVLGEGPCLDALWEHEVVVVDDLAHETRWPTWGPRALQEFGVQSLMCVRLFTHERSLGALLLLSHQTGAFDSADREELVAVAAQAAVAMAVAGKVASAHTALDTRTVIGQATGVLMERYRMDAGGAFALLVRASNTQNRKLRDVALEVVQRRGKGV